MEAEQSRRRLRALNRLSDCTNTISSTTALAIAASLQSSSSYTIKLKRQNPKLASPSVVSPLIPSAHPCPHPISSSASGNFSAPFLISPFLALGSVHGGRGTCKFCAYLYSTKLDYKVRREIDFVHVSMSPNDKSLYIGIWDRTIWREKPTR
ncbi:hypothetical protein D8674_006183 [Pyrus ussuriensis x Pyrus communis]|uniref:Uncharacterized protein n=1 Tax=Pyrus ussuriensis x Pyrus communis TaxID=2448454 RepID=A0A5N5FTK2_9ROSA|nr:hypothetical protein D8674_006183 [Pyrus ussuriensis x Pyrus communis]